MNASAHIRAARAAACAALAAALAGCVSEQTTEPPRVAEAAPQPRVVEQEPETDGKYYKDDGPPSEDEVDWRTVAEPRPDFPPIGRRGNRPYEVFGVRYVPFEDYMFYREQGMASWYGRRYHGQQTSSGEVYDMYQMTAAHTVLPIPSYARVTRVDDGRTIVVRVNDRGPFLNERIIDLSYTAARKLGVVATGTAEVIVEAILPPLAQRERQQLASSQDDAPQPQQQQPAAESEPLDTGHYLQLGAFGVQGNALRLAATDRLPAGIGPALKVAFRNGLYKVLLGPYLGRAAALADLGQLRSVGLEAIPVEIE